MSETEVYRGHGRSSGAFFPNLLIRLFAIVLAPVGILVATLLVTSLLGKHVTHPEVWNDAIGAWFGCALLTAISGMRIGAIGWGFFALCFVSIFGGITSAVSETSHQWSVWTVLSLSVLAAVVEAWDTELRWFRLLLLFGPIAFVAYIGLRSGTW